MKSVNRVILFLISLCGLVLTFASFSLWFKIPHVSDAVSDLVINEAAFLYIMIGFFIVILLFFIVILFYALLAPAKAKYMSIGTDKGMIKISRDAIESAATNAAADIIGSNTVKVTAKLKKKSPKVKLKVKLLAAPATELGQLPEQIETRMATAVSELVGRPVDKISMTIGEKKPAHKGRHRRVI